MLAPGRGAIAMGARVSITRLDLTATALRAAAGREKDSAAARRMLALALVVCTENPIRVYRAIESANLA